MLSAYFQSYVDRYSAYKGGAWCYEDGCLYRGLELLYKATGEEAWLHGLKTMLDAQILDGPTLKSYSASDYNIDNIQPGRSLLFMHKHTGTQKYLDAAHILAAQLENHPRTVSGVYWHKQRYPWQNWLDGLYMAHPFQVEYGQITGNPAMVEDSLRQISTALEVMIDLKTGLYAHAYDEARAQKWADPATGRSAAHWARALGWLAMSLVDVASLVGPAQFQPLETRSKQLFEQILRLRLESGLWLQVIDQPDLRGNYAETSASAMFAYALQRASSLGLVALPMDVVTPLVSQCIQPKATGGFEMVDICEVAGLGEFEGRYRDGSAAYYTTEARVSDDVKGVAPLMMAVAVHQGALTPA